VLSPPPSAGEGPGVRALPDILWCYVPPGPFLMGDGREQHRNESITDGYLISRYPVTNAQFAAFVEAEGYQEREYWTEAGWEWKEIENWTAPRDYGEPFSLPNHPAVGVSWYEAVAFCRWLEERLQISSFRFQVWRDQQLETWDLKPETLTVRLPSEAEWEKAARGTGGRIFPWGGEPDSDRANYADTGIGTTSAVGCFPGGASPYGVEDLSGNVWGWTRSLWGKSFSEPEFRYPYGPGDGREDREAEPGILRVVRGGAFNVEAGFVRCAFRGGLSPYRPLGRSGDFGFRLVASPVHL
jgi:formylglycine-generating enzyme required for sulfatase activity